MNDGLVYSVWQSLVSLCMAFGFLFSYLVYMSLYELDFLEPLELSPSGCHHFCEGAVQFDLDLAILDIFYDNKSKFKLTGCFRIDDAHHLEGNQRKGMHLVTPHSQPRPLLT